MKIGRHLRRGQSGIRTHDRITIPTFKIGALNQTQPFALVWSLYYTISTCPHHRCLWYSRGGTVSTCQRYLRTRRIGTPLIGYGRYRRCTILLGLCSLHQYNVVPSKRVTIRTLSPIDTRRTVPTVDTLPAIGILRTPLACCITKLALCVSYPRYLQYLFGTVKVDTHGREFKG